MIENVIQRKANAASIMIEKVTEVAKGTAPTNVKWCMEALPCEVDDKGSFLILTGTRDVPSGIGVASPPETILLYNKKGGVLVDTSALLNKFRENKDQLTVEIDETYSIMGVRLNVGIISSWLGEDFLTALHLSSLHDS